MSGDEAKFFINVRESVKCERTKDSTSKRTEFKKHDLTKPVDKILNTHLALLVDEGEEDSNVLEGEGMKTIIPSNLIDNYTRLEVLVGLKLSSHIDTLTEVSNLIDELYKTGEIQNEQQYRNALNKFSFQQMDSPTKIIEQIAFIT